MRSPFELHQRFAESEYGRKLEGCIRFADFKPEDTSNELWGELLGDDVNNLRHMPHTARIAARFSIAQAQNEEDALKVFTTAITHDWGEAIITDIGLPLKTHDDEVAEQLGYRAIAEDLLGKYEGEELSDMVWSILDHTDRELGPQFKAIEYIGYCTTAARAGYVGRAVMTRVIDPPMTRPEREHLVGALLGLENSLVVHSYPTLAKFAKEYSAIEKIMVDGVPYRHTTRGATT